MSIPKKPSLTVFDPKKNDPEQPKKAFGGRDNGTPNTDAFIIERVSNGYVCRFLIGPATPEGEMAEDVMVFTNSTDLLRELAKFL